MMPATINKADPAPTLTDWARLRSVTDEEIARAVADDPDAAPIYTAEEMKQFKPHPARIKR